MLPAFLYPEEVVTTTGEGPTVGLDSARGGRLQLTVGITEVREQQSLDVVLYGSEDGESWGKTPLAHFPQQFYIGTASLAVDLANTPEVRFVRIHYKANRWGLWREGAQFKFYVFAEAVGA